MTETPFKAYKADVKFDPIKDSGDGLIESAEANQNKFLESLAKRNADLFKYELEHAKIKDSRIDKLAELSTTVAKGVAPIWEAHKNEKYLEGAKLWKKDLAENQEAQQIQFDIDEQQLLTEEQINNEIVDAAEENGEIDPWLKDRLKKLPRLQRYGYLKAIYSQEAKMYPLYREQNKTIPVSIKTSDGQIVNRALEDAKDPNEWNQINERLINGYIRPFASEGHKQPMLKKYLYKEMDTIEEDEFKSWSTKKIEEITNETNEKSDNTFKNDVSKNPNAVMNYALAEAGRHGGISKSHDKAIELYKEDIGLGLLNSDDVDDLEDSDYTDKTTNKEYKYGKRFPRKILELRNAIHERDAKELKKKIEKEAIAFRQDEDQAINDLPDNPTDDDIDKAQQGLMATHYQNSKKLEKISQDLTIDAIELNKYEKIAESYADLGLLTNERLATLPWQVQRKFQDVAQFQTKVNTEGKVWEKAIAADVKGKARPFAGTQEYAGSVLIVTSRLQQLFRQEAAKALENNIDDPYAYAYGKVKVELENLKKTERGFIVEGVKSGDELTNETVKINQNRKQTNSLIISGPQNLDEQDTFFSAVEISNALKGYGKPGWEPHERAVYIATQFGIDPLAVLERQAKAYDPKVDLQEPASIKTFNEKVDKYHKSLILSESPSYEGLSRAWGTTGEVNYSMFKNEEQAKELAKELGISDYEVEALAELGLLEKEERDEDEENNYWKAVWKLSGGTDIRALNQLTRPTFKP